MKSREAIYIYFNMSAEEGRKTQPSCQSINQVAYDQVISKLENGNDFEKKVLSRYQKFG